MKPKKQTTPKVNDVAPEVRMSRIGSAGKAGLILKAANQAAQEDAQGRITNSTRSVAVFATLEKFFKHGKSRSPEVIDN